MFTFRYQCDGKILSKLPKNLLKQARFIDAEDWNDMINGDPKQNTFFTQL